MICRPILFSGEMVRAILAGRKTQTRRELKMCHFGVPRIAWDSSVSGFVAEYLKGAPLSGIVKQCPYGRPGDQLWVRETTVDVETHGYIGPVYAESEEGRAVRDYGLSPSPDDVTEVEPYDIKLRPSIFMPRSMTRITLEITGIRIERLQDISEADAIAEGVKNSLHLPGGRFARENYEHLWWTINGDGSWEKNPWVWVIEFKRVMTEQIATGKASALS